MQRYDESYSDYYDSRDPDGYPYGKAVDASSPDTPDGTPIKASFFNDIIGMMQAIHKGASPEGTPITGRPDRVNESDVWNALRGFIEREVHRVLKLVPSEATEENQLADKKFVDDAVSTNSAFFLGDFNSVEELPTVGVTNNDYAYVKRTEGIRLYYDRYKYNSREAAWGFEYTLDNTTVPIATAVAAGIVKGGGNVTIGADGTLNAPSARIATASVAGIVKGGGNVTIGADGTLNAPNSGISIVAKNYGANSGYVKYSDGLIIQWGRFYGSGTSLSISFSNTNYIVVDTISNEDSEVGPADALRPDTVSRIQVMPGSLSWKHNHQWIAIGI